MKQAILNHFGNDLSPIFKAELSGVRNGNGDECTALCPFHEDKTQSLSFNAKTNVFFCHACGAKGDVFELYKRKHGCANFTETCRLIGENFGIPLPENGRKPNANGTPFHHYQLGKPVEKYAYTDESGTVLYYSCRFEPKTFRQCGPDGLSWSVKDVRKVPYGLPKVLGAEEVFAVEGEKDVHSLEKIGLVATCNVAGAGKWTDDLSDYFRGKSVVVLPDNDEPGRKHARMVADSLRGIARSIKVVELPGLTEKGDVSDFLDGFGDADEALERLSMLVDGAGEFETGPQQEDTDDRPREERKPIFKIQHISELKIVPPKLLIKDILEADALSLVFGDPESGKSLVAIEWCCCVATKKDFHGKKALNGGPVLYIAGEGQNGIRRRFEAWAITHGVDINEFPIHVCVTPASLTDQEHTEFVLAAINGMKELPVLVVVDTVARNFGPGDENSTRDMNVFVQSADRIRAIATRPHVCLVHHTGHADKSRARGAMALKGALDAEYKVEKGQDDIVRFEATKMKDAPKPKPMAFFIKGVKLGIATEEGDPVTSAVLVGTDYTEPPAQGKKSCGPNQVKAMRILKELAKLHGGDGCSEHASVKADIWREACLESGLKASTFCQIRKSLTTNGEIEDDGDFVSFL